MKKGQGTTIVVLVAIILGLIMFIVGFIGTKSKSDDNPKKEVNKERWEIDSEKTTSNENEEEGSSKKEKSAEKATENKTESEKEQKEEEKEETPEENTEVKEETPDKDEEVKDEGEKEEEPQKEPVKEQETEENSQTSHSDYSDESAGWYRVRTADGKQDSAFKSFEYAKARANELKDQGYKVYDSDMNCVYEP